MSMKPGDTMRPRASTVRAASPERLGPTETMRSFSMATSAATAGAPLPSTTVPFLIRSDQLMSVGPRASLLGGLDDLHRLHLVALLDLVHHVHPRGDRAEDGVLAVQEIGRGQGDVELAAGGVRVVAPRHGHRA